MLVNGAGVTGCLRRTQRTHSPPTASQFKRARVDSLVAPSPEAPGTSSFVPSPRERFETLLAQAREKQPEGRRETWEGAITCLCLQGRRIVDDEKLRLLHCLLSVPADAQELVATQTRLMCGAGCRGTERQQVLAALVAVAAHGGADEVAEVVEAIAPVRELPARREVLCVLTDYVPASSRLHFLRNAECLLQTGHRDEVRAVCEAARLCTERPRPRGASQAERAARQREARYRPPAAAEPPPFTADDWAILRDAMDEQYNELEEELYRRPPTGFPGENLEAGDHARAALSDVEDTDELTDDDDFNEVDGDGRPRMREVENGEVGTVSGADSDAGASEIASLQRTLLIPRKESVQSSERIRLVKAAWLYLGRYYPRELPEPALFVLVRAAYDALQRQARRKIGPFAEDALAGAEKKWPCGADEEEREELLAQQQPLPRWQALAFVFDGRQGGRMRSVLDDGDMSHALDEAGLTLQKFVSVLWSVAHRRGEGAPRGSLGAERGRSERENLRHSFWMGMLDNLQVSFTRDGERTLMRLCHNGLVQKMLEKFQEYEPFTVSPTQPEQLLTQMCKNFSDELKREHRGEPDEQTLIKFVAQARTISQQSFGKDFQEVFNAHLTTYLTMTYPEHADVALRELHL